MGYFQGIVKHNPWLIFLSFLFLCGFSSADPPYGLCSTNTSIYLDNSPFEKNLDSLLQALRSNASESKFYNTSIGTNEADSVYGLFMCFNYVSQETCHGCIATASNEVLRNLCPNAKQAVVWDEKCQLRYSDYDFFGELNVSGNIPQQNPSSNSLPKSFRGTMEGALRNLTRVAAYGWDDMYAVTEFPFIDDTVYALVQCTRDLSPDQCRDCLGNSTRDILDLSNFSIGARLYSRSCYLRYELYAFYKNESGNSSGNENERDMIFYFAAGFDHTIAFRVAKTKNQPLPILCANSGSKIWRIALIVAGSACLIIGIFTCSFIAYRLFNKRNERRNYEDQGRNSRGNVNKSNDLKAQEYPCVDLLSILIATGSFSESNKLGQGSFGPVYKGVLREGKEVAVKRLLFCSEQGSEEFTNEVLLIMKLQHKNLVKLLGFCSDRDEKLLVYEYMPNKSLDVILFDPNIRAKLDWSTRINIIIGIARGLLYLHEDSRLRVIHRDLKASNILLDSDMNPKISDFGIARIFAGSEEQANTSTIVGTYGYMAPEYAMEGIYSIKSDVFSFGVLLIEVISGKRNAGFSEMEGAPSLLAYAWHLWQSGQMLELIDPLITVSCDDDEFLRYLHIGLLCVQEDAFDRPTMSTVVVILKSETTTLSQPKRPAFFTGRLSERRKSVVDLSFSTNSFTFL